MKKGKKHPPGKTKEKNGKKNYPPEKDKRYYPDGAAQPGDGERGAGAGDADVPRGRVQGK